VDCFQLRGLGLEADTTLAACDDISLTALSWFGLGIWYGWGYCPSTDWHWQIRALLGYQDPRSYVQLLIGELTGIDIDPDSANALALGTLIIVGVLTSFLNVRDIRRDSKLKQGIGVA